MRGGPFDLVVHQVQDNSLRKDAIGPINARFQKIRHMPSLHFGHLLSQDE